MGTGSGADALGPGGVVAGDKANGVSDAVGLGDAQISPYNPKFCMANRTKNNLMVL